MGRKALVLAVVIVFVFSVQSVSAYNLQDLINSFVSNQNQATLGDAFGFLRSLFFPTVQSGLTASSCTCSGTNIEHCSTGCSNAGAVCTSPSGCIPLATTTTQQATTTTKQSTTTTQQATTTTKQSTTTTAPGATTTTYPCTAACATACSNQGYSTSCCRSSCYSGETPVADSCAASMSCCCGNPYSTTTTTPGGTTTTTISGSPQITIDKTTYSQGQNVIFSGSGFTAGIKVLGCMSLDNSNFSPTGPVTWICDGSHVYTVSSQGTVSGVFLVGSNIPVGPQKFVVAEITSSTIYSNQIQVQITGSSTTTTIIASTCANTNCLSANSVPCKCGTATCQSGYLYCCVATNTCNPTSCSSCSGSTTTTTYPCTEACATACSNQGYSTSCCRSSCYSGETNIGQTGCAASSCCCSGAETACTDSDATSANAGKNYLVKGTCTSSGGPYPDTCSFIGTLTEWYCDANNLCSFESINCANVCSGCVCINGACSIPPTTTTISGSTTTTISGSTTTTISGSTTTTISGSTTTTTISGSTTTTTTTPTSFSVLCDECFAGSTCYCNISVPCDEGIWNIINKDKTPMQYPVVQKIPPIKVSFVPNTTGTVEAIATCVKPTYTPSSQSIDVLVKPPFLICANPCSVNQKCDCVVNGCKDGKFMAILGNIVLKNEAISTETYSASMYPQTTGSIDVEVTCKNPNHADQASILVSGTGPPPTIGPQGKFTGILSCISTSSGYRCSLDYSNGYGPAYLVFFLSKSTSGEVIDYSDSVQVPTGSGTKDTTFTCSSRSGSYYVSWTAFTDSSLTNPIPGAWPKPDERRQITC